ncbi:MAG: hypothetical protein L0H94_02300 [Nitrospira sp.]|nr:hypothetical protein [Nitrospira sp.]
MNTGIKNLRYRLTVPSLILGLIGLSACSMLASPTSGSGEVHVVKIEEGVAPSVLDVGIDDEVRWVNHRSDDVRIDSLGDALDHVSCKRGFTNWLAGQKESATIGPNKSASLCFTKAGVVTYTIRMKSALLGGKQNVVQGEVRVRRHRGAADTY